MEFLPRWDGPRSLAIWGGQRWGQVGQMCKKQKLFTLFISLLKAETVLIHNKLSWGVEGEEGNPKLFLLRKSDKLINLERVYTETKKLTLQTDSWQG